MKKFKISDSATFSFKHVLDNALTFFLKEKRTLGIIVLCMVLMIGSAVSLAMPVYNNFQSQIPALESIDEKQSMLNDKMEEYSSSDTEMPQELLDEKIIIYFQ